MSKKHNCKHPRRGLSLYPERLAARGVTSKRVRMESAETLRKRQERRKEETGSLWPAEGKGDA